MTDDGTGPDRDSVALEALLGHIREVRGFDFSGYKRASLTRRIDKRMSDAGSKDYVSYLRLLETSPDEFTHLFDTILINVTAFLRDRPAWDHLAAEVIPKLVDRPANEPIRVWSAGCASGEEAYSVAMLLCEALGDERFRTTVKIYGSDADEGAIAQARRARYPIEAVRAAVDEERIERFFIRSDGYVTFRNDLRRAVIFGRHDLLQDPPISRVDLILCRNTLMYFNADMQRRILGNFHFSLNERGYLFLGKAEALATRSDLFAVDNLNHHVFVRTGARRPRPPLVGLQAPAAATGRPDENTELLLRAGFESNVAAQLLVDRRGILVGANRHARATFAVKSSEIGLPFKDAKVSYRPAELRSRIDQALIEHRPISVPDVEWESPTGADALFDIRLQPVGPDLAPIGVAITFVETGRYKLLREELEHAQRQLGTAYEELQSTVEELETTNEELQSTNEELETTNEELHSTNEELETMNEELQSTNEELQAINGELRERSTELDGVNDFLGSILGSLSAGIVVLDRSLGVRIWNQQAEELWGLRADEVEGRPFMNLDIGLPVEELRQPVTSIMADGHGGPVEVTVDAVNRRGRSLRCRTNIARLQRPDGESDGVIIRMEPEPTAADRAQDAR